MKTKCTNCGKKYQQSEAYENHYALPAMCMRCALIKLTADDDFDQEPDWLDIENAWARSGQATYEELDEIAEEARRYPEESDDEKYGYCKCCGSQLDRHEYFYSGLLCCSNAEILAQEQDRLADEEDDPLTTFESLYDEALEEDQDRKIVADQEAQQAKWDAQFAEWERLEAESLEFWAREQEWNDSFVPILYDIFGRTKYDTLIAPILIGWLRFKKRWRH